MPFGAPRPLLPQSSRGLRSRALLPTERTARGAEDEVALGAAGLSRGAQRLAEPSQAGTLRPGGAPGRTRRAAAPSRMRTRNLEQL